MDGAHECHPAAIWIWGWRVNGSFPAHDNKTVIF